MTARATGSEALQRPAVAWCGPIRAISTGCRPDEADVLISDAGLAVDAQAALRAQVGQVVVVDPATGEVVQEAVAS